MNKLRVIRLVWVFFIAFVYIALVGCGPSTFTRIRTFAEPYASDSDTKTDSGITIQYYFVKEIPPDFFANVQGCNKTNGKLFVTKKGEPVMEKQSIVPNGAWFGKFAITNNTGHIVRLNSTVFTAFDPADNQYDSLSKEEITSHLMQDRPCSSTGQLANQINLVKLITRNTELLPNRTTTGYLFYKPQDLFMPGIWKLSFYELPVKTNAAGVATKTVNFDFKILSKKYQDTYRRESPFATPVKISTEEIK